MKHNLMNVIIDAGDFLADHCDLLYRAADPAAVRVHAVEDGQSELAFAGEVDFLTYFNALPLAKWRQYAGLSNVQLLFEATEGVRLQVRSAFAQNPGADAKAVVESQEVDLADARQGELSPDGFYAYTVDMPVHDAALVGFAVSAEGPARIRNMRFATEVDEASINDVRLAIATTTFNNEDYIVPNMQAIQKQIVESSDSLAQAFHLFVVDNGRTLDANLLREAGIAVGEPDELGRMKARGITVCPNPNVGGAGGFARGMMEAMGWTGDGEADAPHYTHVLLMDDDVTVFPESIKRTFNLLRLAQGEYRHAFVNGAMLKRQEPESQFEDVSYARKSGGYDRFKPTFDISQLDDIVRNETISVEGDHAYGAWWYSCVPATAILEHGLPMPFFVRGDDVEYGLRCKGTYMVMSGICVWHEHFTGRFRASVDCYQYVRNLLAMSSIHDNVSMSAFMARFWRVFHIFLRTMNYDSADLWLDGMEDYLRGPEWLASADGAAIMKANAAKNEKLVPLEEIDAELLERIDMDATPLGVEEEQRSALSKMFESLPHDRHWFPDALLRKAPAGIDYSGNLGSWKQVAMRSTLVAFDAKGENAHVRTLDRERYRQLMARYRSLVTDYRSRSAQLQHAWKEAHPYLTSREFWTQRLGLAEQGEQEKGTN